MRIRWIIFTLVLVFCGGLYGAGAISPDRIPGVVKVNAEGVVDLVQHIPSLIIIDSRIAMDQAHGYIEGSVSLPDVKTDCRSLSKVIPTRTTPTLFYCNGVKCGRSVKAVNIALRCKYKQLYWFRGGFTEWKQKDFPILTDH